MRGGNVRKLEDLIVANLSSPNDANLGNSMKPSPYSSFPLHASNMPIYKKMPIRKMKQKLAELNEKLKADDGNEAKDENSNKKVKRSMDESEQKLLAQMMAMLEAKNVNLNAAHFKLLEKFLNKWPASMLPPVLDLLRVLSLQPSFAEHCALRFDFVLDILRIAGNGMSNGINGMLCCRIVINLFSRRSVGRILERHYCQIVDALIFNMLCNERKNTRLAFVRVLLHFAYCFYRIGYHQSSMAEKLKIFALFSEMLHIEKDTDIILNILMGIGTLLFRDQHVIQFANTLDMILVFKSYKQRYAANADIAAICGELIQAMQNPKM